MQLFYNAHVFAFVVDDRRGKSMCFIKVLLIHPHKQFSQAIIHRILLLGYAVESVSRIEDLEPVKHHNDHSIIIYDTYDEITLSSLKYSLEQWLPSANFMAVNPMKYSAHDKLKLDIYCNIISVMGKLACLLGEAITESDLKEPRRSHSQPCELLTEDINSAHRFAQPQYL